jgi:N-acetylglucosamine-6-phosphate deacetylase
MHRVRSFVDSDSIRPPSYVSGSGARRGIDARVGSLEPGNDADLVVLDGDPLDPRTRIEQVFVEGERVLSAPASSRR